jgi:hypothetical protein
MFDKITTLAPVSTAKVITASDAFLATTKFQSKRAFIKDCFFFVGHEMADEHLNDLASGMLDEIDHKGETYRITDKLEFLKYLRDTCLAASH